MPNPAAAPLDFIISAEDHDLACSVLQARFFPGDPQQLVAMIPDADQNDPDLWNRSYELDEAVWRGIVEAFNIPFCTSRLEGRDISVCIWRPHSISKAPYLVHTGYELLLLLNGQKKLARMGDAYPPMTFLGEEAFERYVASGDLHREEVVKPFDKPARQYLGVRDVYYTPKGEEWRIKAMQLIWDACEKSGGWNESYERLEGMLFGYEDRQNDWWAEQQKRRGGSFRGMPFCCSISATGLAWLESAGRKALPPANDIILHLFDYEDAEQPEHLLADVPAAAAVIRFNAAPRFIADIIDYKAGGPWHVSAEKIPGLNANIRGSIEILLQKPQPAEIISSPPI